MRPWLPLILACSLVACAPSSPPSSAAPATSAAAPGSAEEARDVCRRIRLATRACGELYVPALLRTRARFDQPPGIAARYKAEGEEKLLAVAREEFKIDWSDPSTESYCQKLVDMPVERRTTVVERERSCLPVAGDCAAFVECNVHNLERKWSAPPTPPATPPPK